MSTISRTAFWAQFDGIHERLSLNSGSRWGFRVWQLIMNSRSRCRSISSIWMLWILCRSCAELFGSRWISRPLRPKLGALLVTADADSLLSARSTSGKVNMFGSLIKRGLLSGSLIVCWLLFRTEIFSFSRRAKSSDKRKLVNNKKKKSKNCSKLQESDHIGHHIEPSTDHLSTPILWMTTFQDIHYLILSPDKVATWWSSSMRYWASTPEGEISMKNQDSFNFIPSLKL